MYSCGKAEYSQHNFRSRKNKVSFYFGRCGGIDSGYFLSGTVAIFFPYFGFLYLLSHYSQFSELC